MIPPLRIIFTGYATGDNLKQLYSNAAFNLYYHQEMKVFQ